MVSRGERATVQRGGRDLCYVVNEFVGSLHETWQQDQHVWPTFVVYKKRLEEAFGGQAGVIREI